MMGQQSITGALGRLCWYRRVLQVLCGGYACTEEHNRNSREAVLV